MNKKEWGIDLTGRKMLYAPWPVDTLGIYRLPTQSEIEEVYGISGEAVRETLLYFEERADIEQADSGGALSATQHLVLMLNDHAIDDKYRITRDELLDPSRWYNNEYYFYFIMFTKKVIGRYDFHYGEGDKGQVSIHHKIFEKGFVEQIPWGVDGHGKTVHDFAITNCVGPLKYIEENNYDISDGLLFINSILPNGFNVDREFFNNETFWISGEFLQYCYTIISILSNDLEILIKSAEYSVREKLRTARLIVNVPKKIALSVMKTVTSKANSVYKYDFEIESNFIIISVSFQKHFQVQQYSKYILSCLNNSSRIHIGAFKAIFELLYRRSISNYNDTLLGNYSGFNLSYNIEGNSRNIIINIIIIMLILIINIIYGIIIDFPNYSIIGISIVVYFLLIWIVGQKNLINELSSKLIESSQSAQEQLLSLEKISERLLEERNNLEISVKLRTNELAIANEKLKELDKLKSEFFANVSHEIRTPLTLILTPVNAVLSNKYGMEPDRAFIESIQRNASRLLGLVNDLLDFSRVDAGRVNLKVQVVNLIELMKEHTGMVLSVCEAKGISLDFYAGSEPVFIMVDRSMMDKIVSNLLSNAIKFTEQGGWIRIRVYIEMGKKANIEVEDNGIGIPEEKIDSVFDRFSQADASSTRCYEGTGIGLALVKEFVTLHGGSVQVESRYHGQYPINHGSTFTISIPMGNDHLEGRTDVEFMDNIDKKEMLDYMYTESLIDGNMKINSQESQINDDDGKPTLLIVEDNLDMHDLLRRLLGDSYNILTAMNGREALNILEFEAFIPDLVLADVMMPEMDGYELTQCLRKDSRFEGIPIILLTAKADEAMKIEGFERGATDYILKPFSAPELTSRIKAQIEMKKVRDRLARTNEMLYKKLASDKKGLSVVSVSSEEKVLRVADFLRENYAADLSREGLAAAVDMSPDHLSRVFNRVQGKRIDEFINELRIQEAVKRLKYSDDTVTSIAFSVGFDNLRSFYSAFHKFTHKKPSDLRHS